jgi:lysozyme family protein
MSKFDLAKDVLLADEGGLSEAHADHGGLTKFGISSHSYPDLDIASLTEADARAIYERDYWHPLWNQLESQALATKLLVMSVNMGQQGTIVLLQQAVNDCRGHLKEDGLFGPGTLEAVNALPESQLLLELRARGILHYVTIILRDPTQAVWARGWIRRQLA